jgi:hypothetical protein
MFNIPANSFEPITRNSARSHAFPRNERAGKPTNKGADLNASSFFRDQ